MSQAQQPEALASWTGDTDVDSALIMLDRIDCSHDDDARIDAVTATLRKLHARVQELEAEVASERRHKPARDVAAVRTLAALGYDWHGGEQWKPPLQERKPLTDGEIIAAQERLIAAKDELYRSRIGLTCAHCKTGKYRADGNGYHDFHRCDSCRHAPMFGADGKEFGIQEKHG